MRELLREYISFLLESNSSHDSVKFSGSGLQYLKPGRVETDASKKDNLLVEPDDPEEQEEAEEASIAANVAGVTVPLGAGPTYPSKPKKKKRRKRS